MTVVPTAREGSTPSAGVNETSPAEKRRNRPGTSASSFCNWSEENFEEMESTLAVQQYIQQTIRRDVSDVEAILCAPDSQDEGVWKYEHLRQFSMELNGLAVALQSECQPETCTQMTATEQWIFLVSQTPCLHVSVSPCLRVSVSSCLRVFPDTETRGLVLLFLLLEN